MKIDELTYEQTKLIAEYRDWYFKQATSIEPADRPRAEKAALRMAEIAGMKVDKMQWVISPVDFSLCSEPPRSSLGNTFWDSIGNYISTSLMAPFSTQLRTSISAALNAPIGASLSELFRFSLWCELSSWLNESLKPALNDIGWLAYYSYIVNIMKIECDDLTREKLQLHNDVTSSCFALWITPEVLVLCDRPLSVKIVNDKLVGLTWRTE